MKIPRILVAVSCLLVCNMALAQTTTPSTSTPISVGGSSTSTTITDISTALATDSPWSASFAFSTAGQPYGLLMYTPKNWDESKKKDGSFILSLDTFTGASLDKSTSVTGGFGVSFNYTAQDFTLYAGLGLGEVTDSNQKVTTQGFGFIGVRIQFGG